MSFPLPQGVCRSVCRPVRSTPRLMLTRDVVRLARAAVKNGDEPCNVVLAVSKALECEPCARELADVVEGRDNLLGAWRAVRSALATLLEIMGLAILAEGLREEDIPDIPPEELPGDSWWRSFWRRWVPIFRAIRFLVALQELVRALLEFNTAIRLFLESLQEYFACLAKTEENSG